MYNSERKTLFIEEYKLQNATTISNFIPKFNRVEKYEELLGKDLCEFTISEILDYYKIIGTCSMDYLISTNSTFSLYTQRCLNQFLVPDCQNHYLEVTTELLSTCLNLEITKSRTISRNELIRQLDMLDNPSDCFMMLAIFEGIFGSNYDELTFAKLDQIHGNKMYLYGGRVLTISDKLKHYAEEAANEYKYYCYTFIETGRNNERNLNPLDDHIIKGMYNAGDQPSETARFQRMHGRTKRLRIYLGSECFRTRSLMESGRIDMIKNLMNNGNYNSVFDCINKNKNDIYYRYGTIPSIKRYLLKYGEYFK